MCMDCARQRRALHVKTTILCVAVMPYLTKKSPSIRFSSTTPQGWNVLNQSQPLAMVAEAAVGIPVVCPQLHGLSFDRVHNMGLAAREPICSIAARLRLQGTASAVSPSVPHWAFPRFCHGCHPSLYQATSCLRRLDIACRVMTRQLVFRTCRPNYKTCRRVIPSTYQF